VKEKKKRVKRGCRTGEKTQGSGGINSMGALGSAYLSGTIRGGLSGEEGYFHVLGSRGEKRARHSSQ